MLPSEKLWETETLNNTQQSQKKLGFRNSWFSSSRSGLEKGLMDFKIATGVEKSACPSPAPVKIPALECECPTPEKISDPLPTNLQQGQLQLPDKSAADFLDHMNCSLRLLRLRKKSTTFQNISTQVEILAKRKFLYSHLAQIKFILPEAIKIDWVLVSDKETQFMKPDINISLLFDIVKGHREISDFTALRQVFASRLMSFFAMHPEASDVPEAILPEPFSKRSQTPVLKQLSTDSSTEPKPTSIETELLSEKVCPYPYISRHFSRNNVVAETEKTQVLSSPLPLPLAGGMNNQGIKSGLQKEFHVVSYDPEQDIKNWQRKESCSKSSIIDHSIHLNHPQPSIGSSIPDSPLVKLTSSANSLMIETPQPLTPRRSMPSCDAKHETLNTQKSTSCYKPAKRVLDFSDLEGDKSALDYTADESGCYNIVHQDIPKATGKTVGDRYLTCSPAWQEVERVLGNVDCKKTQTSSLMRLQMSTRLADMVTLIYGVLKSFNWSPITKEELVHKIIMNSLDIIERKEVEEQFGLLERHVPDWIQSKLLSSGDIMYTVKRVPNLDSVLSKLKHLTVSDQKVEASEG
ncbi:CDT1-like protein a, chloroplastic [Rosa sericea]